jgi:hypothetical protein
MKMKKLNMNVLFLFLIIGFYFLFSKIIFLIVVIVGFFSIVSYCVLSQIVDLCCSSIGKKVFFENFVLFFWRFPFPR